MDKYKEELENLHITLGRIESEIKKIIFNEDAELTEEDLKRVKVLKEEEKFVRAKMSEVRLKIRAEEEKAKKELEKENNYTFVEEIEPEEKTIGKEEKVKEKNIFLGVSLFALSLAIASLAFTIGKTKKEKGGNVCPTFNPVVTCTPYINDGEVGTFIDINNDSQVNARANYIYNNYLKFTEKLDLPMGNVTVDDIANIIRVENGRLPLDKNGNAFYKEDLTDEYGNLFAYIVCDLPSSPKLNGLKHVPSSLFTTDNSDLSKFLNKFDQSYEKYVNAYNKDDKEELMNSAKEIGDNILQSWIYQGMYNGYNPYVLEEENLSFAFTGSMFKFPQYITEFNLGTKKPICINTCTDYETGKVMEETINNIYVAAIDNSWDFVNHKLAGTAKPEVERDCVVFDAKLQETLKLEAQKLGLIDIKTLN